MQSLVNGGNRTDRGTLANNSACYSEKDQILVFLWTRGNLFMILSLVKEVFSTVSLQIKWFAKNGRRTVDGHEFGTNPCSEIILRDREFCNLSEGCNSCW